MASGGDRPRPYHALVTWPWPDDGQDRVGGVLARLGGVPVVEGLDRLYGFASAEERGRAMDRARALFGVGCVRALGIVAG